MIVTPKRLDYILSVLFVVLAGACSGTSGCGACSTVGPLPGGALPATQTIEGGAQIRITKAGFTKLTSILPGVISSSLGGGFCLPKGSELGVDYCGNNDGTCGPGCDVHVAMNSLSTSVTNSQQLNIHVDAKGNTAIPFDAGFVGSCTMNASVDHLVADVDLSLGIDATTGELTIHVSNVNNLSISGINFSGCGILGDIVDDVAGLISDILDSGLGQFAVQLLTPVIDNVIQGLLPSPLGIAGVLNVGDLFASVSPGTVAEMEARVVPGGYVTLTGNGLSLGVITGLNSDQDPSTRTPGLDSEPALCVPPIPAPDFNQVPLPKSSRGTFELAPAGAFSGAADPNADLAMGISKTTLDLAGHHAVTSGALCLSIGTSFIKQLNVGTIGILVPSLSDLDSTGTAPLMLVTRPQRELTFDVGSDSATDALTIHVSHMEIDFYAFIYERYVRAFTMDISLDAKIGLQFEQQGSGAAVIKPTLSGISSQSVTVTVLNSEFVKETPDALQMVLPSVFDLITPLLGNLPDITVPSFAGFSLSNLTIQKVTTSQDDFLALTASLGASAAFRDLATHNAFAAEGLTKLDGALPPVNTTPSTGTARLVRVATPEPEIVRAALAGAPGAQLPSVEFDADAIDSNGREIEWSWNINGGLWRPYQPGGQLVIADRAFAWQGKYEIGLKSRVKGDYHTVMYAPVTAVDIDSVNPTIDSSTAALTLTDEGALRLPIHDVVSEGHLVYAFGLPGQTQPLTKWTAGDAAVLTEVDAGLFTDETKLAVYARDEAGNTTRIDITNPFHGSAGGAGCACDSGGGPSSGGLLLLGLVGALIAVPRRRRRLVNHRALLALARWAGLSVALSLAPGCSCDKTTGGQGAACEMDSDCPANACMTGQLPFCVEGTCQCSDDVPVGRLGPYQSIATAPDGTAWVSAYSEYHGDLVVTSIVGGGRIADTAWEWVDGIPAVAPEIPGSMIRGGITDPGPDVGMYTSIAVAPDGTPMVTYFDVDNASLKFAAKVAGQWQIHTVDAGTGPIDPGGTGAEVGMYTSITLRTDDGRPGVAYLAHVSDGSGTRAEVRFAASQVPVPMAASDWQTWVVDTGQVPDGSDDVYPLPGGLGLFIDVARDPNTQAPVVAYYDRALGELKLSKFDTSTGEFATPVVLAGTADDAGWSPSVVVDTQSVAHVAYVDSTSDTLAIVTDQANAKPTTIDNGYRIVGESVDGYPKPTFDFVGDDAKLILTPSGYYVSYQDATTQELLLAHQKTDGTWSHQSIAGATTPWPGAYGFFASAAQTATQIVMSTWVIDQPNGENWVEVFRQQPVVE